jgi:hypothetical protein
MRRSQISVFVIAGIVLLIITAFFVIKLNEEKIQRITTIDREDTLTKPVVTHVNACIKKISFEAMQKLGDQGLIYPDAFLAAGGNKIAYFYYQRISFFPDSIQDIEYEISDYIEERIESCIKSFSRPGYVVEYPGRSKINAVFTENELNVTLIYPIDIYSAGREVSLNKFSSVSNSRFFDIYRLSEDIYERTVQNPDWISLDYNSQLFDITLIRVDSHTIIYEIADTRYGLDSKPFRYRFAVKYGL